MPQAKMLTEQNAMVILLTHMINFVFFGIENVD